MGLGSGVARLGAGHQTRVEIGGGPYLLVQSEGHSCVSDGYRLLRLMPGVGCKETNRFFCLFFWDNLRGAMRMLLVERRSILINRG